MIFTIHYTSNNNTYGGCLYKAHPPPGPSGMTLMALYRATQKKRNRKLSMFYHNLITIIIHKWHIFVKFRSSSFIWCNSYDAYFTHEWLKEIWRKETKKSFLESSFSALSYDTSIRKNEPGMTKFCCLKWCLHFHNCIKRIRFHWLPAVAANGIDKRLNSFRWRSAIDERLHAWLIVNETELSLLSILLVATPGSQWKRTFKINLWKCKHHFKQTELCYSLPTCFPILLQYFHDMRVYAECLGNLILVYSPFLWMEYNFYGFNSGNLNRFMCSQPFLLVSKYVEISLKFGSITIDKSYILLFLKLFLK